MKIYLDEVSLDKDRTVRFVDLKFDAVRFNIRFNDRDRIYLKEIDNAELKENNKVVTPFGYTDISNISTGCKVLILLNHSKELGNLIISIDECGDNALDFVYDMQDIEVYTSFYNTPNKINYKKQIEVVKNNKTVKMTMGELINHLESEG